MKELAEFFSYSIAYEIMPDLAYKPSTKQRTHFALILDSGESISKSEINEIKNRLGLSPLFIDISSASNDTAILSYARILHAPLIQPKSKNEFIIATKDSAFTVCENITGGFFSLFSHTPSYLNAGNEKCRRFMAEAAKWNLKTEIIMPYTKNRTAFIRRPVVSEEDFYLAKNKIRAEVGANFKAILYMPN